MSTHVPDEHTLQSLKAEVDSAVELLRTLTKSSPSHVVGKSQRLPAEEVQLAQGLAFVQATKAGLVATVVSGHGILLKRLKDSPSGWSAPLLFDLRSVGVGAAAGFSKTSSVLVLDTEHSVNNFLHFQASLDSEVTVAAGPAAREMHSSELNLSHPSDTFSGAQYSVAHGAMVDVSFQGVKMGVKHSAMRKLYGEGVSESQVLDGTVPQLPVVEALTAELALLQRAGGATAASGQTN